MLPMAGGLSTPVGGSRGAAVDYTPIAFDLDVLSEADLDGAMEQLAAEALPATRPAVPQRPAAVFAAPGSGAAAAAMSPAISAFNGFPAAATSPWLQLAPPLPVGVRPPMRMP